jgi:hypothetical protein
MPNEHFFYVFIVPRPILRHFGEFGEIRLLPGENTRFLAEGGQYGVSKRRAMTNFEIFFCVEFKLHLIIAWSRSMKLDISGDIWILSDFRHYTQIKITQKIPNIFFATFAINSP